MTAPTGIEHCMCLRKPCCTRSLHTWQLIPKKPQVERDGLEVTQIITGATNRHSQHIGIVPDIRAIGLQEGGVLQHAAAATLMGRCHACQSYPPGVIQLLHPLSKGVFCYFNAHCVLGGLALPSRPGKPASLLAGWGPETLESSQNLIGVSIQVACSPGLSNQ